MDTTPIIKELIRYYKGKHKLMRISAVSPMKTAIYQALETFEIDTKYGKLKIFEDQNICCPVRLCWKYKK